MLSHRISHGNSLHRRFSDFVQFLQSGLWTTLEDSIYGNMVDIWTGSAHNSGLEHNPAPSDRQTRKVM
jgi:hypothetical protein